MGRSWEKANQVLNSLIRQSSQGGVQLVRKWPNHISQYSSNLKLHFRREKQSCGALFFLVSGQRYLPLFREKVKECVCQDSATHTLQCWWPSLCYRGRSGNKKEEQVYLSPTLKSQQTEFYSNWLSDVLNNKNDNKKRLSSQPSPDAVILHFHFMDVSLLTDIIFTCLFHVSQPNNNDKYAVQPSNGKLKKP